MRRGLIIIPLGLFLLGVIFLLIGWRWRSPHTEENLVALKGMAYLRTEILKVQNQVHTLEDELLETKRMVSRQDNQQVVNPKAIDICKKNQEQAVSKDLEHKKISQIRLEHRKVGFIRLENPEIELKEVIPDLVDPKKPELKQVEPVQKAKLYSISTQEQTELGSSKLFQRVSDENEKLRQQTSETTPQTENHISQKFKEVLELAAHGQRIPEISQRLFISQDAVRMVLSMQSKGETR